ncbi:helix-turn-helix transcriptional regulator [uncultured Rhodoblastus sp.]|uniref:helix-turn-helix domain-containing protein n=1 Tax=uncultured Rhodoblastus sp. TaxID=543037 RepID=UPI0025E00D50|nr:helix-turn-helix transcriptional regulator [uncultured Rhodoblastus sp.]
MKPNFIGRLASESERKTPDPIDTFVGARLRMRRLSLGINEDELAHMIGATISDVQKFETGESRISAQQLFRISRILKVPMSYFFERGPM